MFLRSVETPLERRHSAEVAVRRRYGDGPHPAHLAFCLEDAIILLLCIEEAWEGRGGGGGVSALSARKGCFAFPPHPSCLSLSLLFQTLSLK